MEKRTVLDRAISWFGGEKYALPTPANVEKRSSLENPSTPLSYPAEWLLDIYNGGRTDSGMRVSELTALQVSTVLCCVNIISNGLATLPLNVIEGSIKDKRLSSSVGYNHNLYDLLHCEPNAEMTSATWRRTLQCHLLLWGNAYSEIQRDGANRVIALWPRNPARTRPVRLLSPQSFQGDFLPQGTLMYETYDSIGDSRINDMDGPEQNYGHRRLILAEDMIHIPGLSLDGRLGQDVVQLGRQAIGLALATEKYGAKFFGNGAIPSGLLSTPGDMTETQWEVLRRSWAEAHGGENTHKTGVLPPGVTYTKTGATPSEGQMLEVRQHQRGEIASMFNVPGHMVGDVDKTSGKSTVEQASIEFVLYCLGPHLNAWEQELKRKLFPKVGQSAGKFSAKFDTRKLMYPDAETRTKFYAGGKNWGYLNSNDVCEMEGLNPITDGSGDVYYMPINMQNAALAGAISSAAQDHVEAGTLAPVALGTQPVGNHPVAVQEKKTAVAAAAASAKAKAESAPADAKPAAGKKAAAKKTTKRACYGLFRDAVGRASHRVKPNVDDFVRIFGPVAAGVIATVEIEADCTQFLKDYTADVFARSVTWDATKLDEIADAECDRVVNQIIEFKYAEEE